MKQYGLGPNGGIVTSLNLFATRFDQVTQSAQSGPKPEQRYTPTQQVIHACVCVCVSCR